MSGRSPGHSEDLKRAGTEHASLLVAPIFALVSFSIGPNYWEPSQDASPDQTPTDSGHLCV